MQKTIATEAKPIKLWFDDIDKDTLDQAKNLANHPFLYHHVAIMPDGHVGYGMPIGGVAALEKVIIPNGVGVDIGCGVAAVETTSSGYDKPIIKKLLGQIRKKIPLGFKHHKTPRPHEDMPALPHGFSEKDLPVISREYDNARRQLGTLGGGNHFLEIQQSERGNIWLMVHSGSRNLGFQVANHYNRIAVALNNKYGQKIPPKWQLDPLPADSETGQQYFREMSYCLRFAAASRQAMLTNLIELVADFDPEVEFGELIDVAHNYAALEVHFGREVFVHRKGATRAGAGETGIIPGSQGSYSYIVRGLGNKDSFLSCSHGAGRRLGRKQAQRELDLKAEIDRLDKLGVIHSIRNQKDLDEAAGAYKDITRVIDLQKDLVEVVSVLKPLGVIKG